MFLLSQNIWLSFFYTIFFILDTKDPSSSSSDSDDEQNNKKENVTPPPKFNTLDIENIIDSMPVDPAYSYSKPQVELKK